MYPHEQLARERHRMDLASARNDRLVRALRAQHRAARQHRRADRALTRARTRVATVTAQAATAVTA